MRQPVFLLTIMVLMSSCTPFTTTTEIFPTATNTAIINSTSTEEPSPTAVATPPPLSFVYQDNIPIDAKLLQEQSANKAYVYYSQYADLGHVTIYTFSDLELILDKISPSLLEDYGQTKDMARSFWPTTGGYITGNDVVINSGFISWTDEGNPCNKAKVVSHEMFHLAQRSLLHHALNKDIDYGPEWLKEGSAEMMGNRMIDALSICNYQKTLNAWFEDSRDADFSLYDVEGRNFNTKIKFWSFAPWAVDYLVSLTPKGDKSLTEYYSAIGSGAGWHEAFKMAFGMSVEDFYTTFKEYNDKTKITMDTSICTAQSDHNVLCLGRKINKSSEFDYIFKLPFAVKTEPQQWKWESTCGITTYGATGTGDVNELILGVDHFTHGNCHVQFVFSKDQRAAVDFFVPVDASVTPVTTVAVKGKIVLADANQNYSDYIVSFCNSKIVECLPGILLPADGTFFTHLEPGDYRISVNPFLGGDALGWYSDKGLVPDTGCAQLITFDRETNLTIDFHPIMCPSVLTPTPETGIIATGVVLPGDNTQKLGDLAVTFCNIQTEQCLPETSVFSDGTFSVYVPTGKYRLSISSHVKGQSLGWYTKQGLVGDPACSAIITIDLKHETALTIHLQEQGCP